MTTPVKKDGANSVKEKVADSVTKHAVLTNRRATYRGEGFAC
jgi:hypothetical protein